MLHGMTDYCRLSFANAAVIPVRSDCVVFVGLREVAIFAFSTLGYRFVGRYCPVIVLSQELSGSNVVLSSFAVPVV